MAAPLKVKALSAAVYRQMFDADGKPLMRVAGVDAGGNVVTEPATRIVLLDRGDELPDDLPAGEIERLRAADAVGEPGEVDALIQRTTNTGLVTDEEEQAAQERLSLQLAPTPGAGLAGMTDDQLVAWISDEKPTVPELVEAVGDDPALARRVLDAEGVATGQDPRSTLVEQLDRVAAGGE